MNGLRRAIACLTLSCLLAIPNQARPQTAEPCVVKPVMTDEDLRRCRDDPENRKPISERKFWGRPSGSQDVPPDLNVPPKKAMRGATMAGPQGGLAQSQPNQPISPASSPAPGATHSPRSTANQSPTLDSNLTDIVNKHLPPLPPLRTSQPDVKDTPPSTYDRLTPTQKAWVDEQLAKQVDATRCRAGVFGQYYQECILDRMPAAKNLIAAGDVMQSCEKSAPCKYVGSKKTGFIVNTTVAECFKKHGYNVTLPIAAATIRAACYDLYPND